MDDCNCSVKKITIHEGMDGSADPRKEANTIKNEWPVATPLLK